MKWPISLELVRHAESAYNVLKKKKAADPRYAEFVAEYKRDYTSALARALAAEIMEKYSLGVSDYKTPLTKEGMEHALGTGRALRGVATLPDIVFFSPYLRTRQTLECLVEGWPELANVKRVAEDRIREQEHGLSLLYNDWRVFHVFHPEQKRLHKLMNPYWYQYPQGESISNVRDRTRDVTGMLIRECAGLRVLLVTHHLTILSFRANLERLTPEEFLRLDEKEKPLNCGVTRYVGHPELGRDGKLILDIYNRQYA